MKENKTQFTSESVDGFIANIENKRRHSDTLIALSLYKEITNLSPVMYGPTIIGFGTYHYKYESGREGVTPAAAFSPRKANITFYVGNNFEGAEELYSKLGKHKKSVACLYINKLADIDLDVLKEIIAREFAKTI